MEWFAGMIQHAVKRRQFSVCENFLVNGSLPSGTSRVMKKEFTSESTPLETVVTGNLASTQAKRRVNVDQAFTRDGDRPILHHRNKYSNPARLCLETNTPHADPLLPVTEETREVTSRTLFIGLKTMPH